MTKTTVYRVEDPEGRGPYSSYLAHMNYMKHSGGRDYPERERTPAPSEDGFSHRDISAHHFFGFASLGELFAWFDGYAQELHRNRYRIAVYEVGDEFVIYGVRQVVFVREEAAEVSSLQLGSDRDIPKPKPKTAKPHYEGGRVMKEQAEKMVANYAKPVTREIEKKQSERRIERTYVASPLGEWGALESYKPIQPRWVDELAQLDLPRKRQLEEQAAFYKLAAGAPLISNKDFLASIAGWDMKSTVPNIKPRVPSTVPDYTAMIRGKADRWQRSGIAVK